MTRALKGFEDTISLSLVEPIRIDDDWEFSENFPDPLYDEEFPRGICLRVDDELIGHVTVSVLWGKQREAIVSNESREIIQMLDEAFDPLAERDVDLNPDDYEEGVDRLVDETCESVNNGVYRAGFATAQEAYEGAVKELSDTLDHWDEILDDQRFLAGDVITEVDIAMFATLVRFGHVYRTYFKCNKRAIHECDNLWNYTKELYQLPGVAKTINMDRIVRHYFVSHSSIDPKRIYGVGPDLDFDARHDRDRLSADLPAVLTADD